MSTHWVEKQKALQNWVVACTGLSADHVIWGGQQGFRPTQPAIVMSLMFINDGGMPWVDHVNNTLTITPLTVTSDGVGTFTSAAAHGRTTGDGPFYLNGTDLPLGTDDETKYWLIVTSPTTFMLAISLANAVNGFSVVLSDAGSGTITLESSEETVPYGAELLFKQRALMKAILTLQCYTAVGVGLDMAQAILWRVNAKRLLPSIKDIIESKNIGVIGVEQVRTIGGTQDLVLFEPRAFVDVQLHITSEDEETGNGIERTVITNEVTARAFTVDTEETVYNGFDLTFDSGFQ